MTARRLLRPLAIVLPPAWTIGVFIVAYMMTQGLVWFFEGMSLKFMGTIDMAIVEPMWRFRAGIATSGAALFAFWRVLAFHPIVYFALRRSLEPARWPNFPLSLQKYQERARQQSWMLLGWPFGFVGPRASPRYLGRADALVIALLLGWFVHSGMAMANLTHQDERGLVAMGSMLICLGAVIRAVGFCVTYWSPISLAGRLLTLRWIIPKYDKALVAPLAAILVLLAGQLVTVKLDVPAYVGQPVVVALCALVLLGVGPSVRDWELTGGHRITPLPYCTKGSQFVRV